MACGLCPQPSRPRPAATGAASSFTVRVSTVTEEARLRQQYPGYTVAKQVLGASSILLTFTRL